MAATMSASVTFATSARVATTKAGSAAKVGLPTVRHAD